MVAAAALQACATVTPFQPNVSEGGRIVTIARPSGSNQDILAASPTGGLFRSHDGGHNWKVVEGLESSFIHDVAFAPSDSKIIIVTFKSDWRTDSPHAPFARSTDGGQSWQAPTDFYSQTGADCHQNVAAYGISFQPNSSTVYIGTSCGIWVSDDLGATWTLERPATPEERNAGPPTRAFYSVLALDGGHVVAIGETAWWRESRTSTWQKSVTALSVPVAPLGHSLAVSPTNPNTIYAVGIASPTSDALVMRSNDGGNSWQAFLGTPASAREAFVKATRQVGTRFSPIGVNSSLYQLYVSDGKWVRQYTVSDGSTQSEAENTMKEPWVEHYDVTDMIFDLDGVTPLMISGDGGVMRQDTSTQHWNLTGGGNGGLNALQIIIVRGQVVDGSDPQIYFGSQDNYIRATNDRGFSWVGYDCCESSLIQLDPVVPNAVGTKVQYIKCGPCTYQRSDPLFQSRAPWNSYSDPAIAGDAQGVGPPILLGGGEFVQPWTSAADPDHHLFKRTADWGTSWEPGAAYVLPELPVGQPIVASRPGALPGEKSLYHVYQRPGEMAGRPQYGLLRVDYPGSGSAKHVDDGLQSVGIREGNELATMGVERPLVAADPTNSNNLFVVDQGEGVVNFSNTGGEVWSPDYQLTSLVTDNGRFKFSALPGGALISEIAWDPYNSCHVLVGTHQGGIYRTANQGLTWERVAGSENIPSVTSFYFPPTGAVVASSYGRGLWKLNVQRNARCQPRPSPFRTEHLSVLIDPNTGAPMPASADAVFPQNCPDCTIIVANEGAFAAIEARGKKISRFALKRGYASEHDRSGREIRLSVPQVRSIAESLSTTTFRRFEREGREIRGLVIRDGALVALLSTDHNLPFNANDRPRISLAKVNDSLSAGPSRPTEKQVAVHAAGFVPRQPVDIEIHGGDRMYAAAQSMADSRGFIASKIEATLPPGHYIALATQRDSNRRLSAAAAFEVSIEEHDVRPTE
jgi:hypothetical protein